MKLLWLTTFLTTITFQLSGQTNFLVEGREVELGSLVKIYDFAFDITDSTNLYFSDSSETYSTPENSIVKILTYQHYKKEVYVRIEYKSSNGQDSVTKLFTGDRLNYIYESGYDHLNRLTYDSRKTFTDDSTFVTETQEFFEYRDSIISTGRIEIQDEYKINEVGNKMLFCRVLNEYDHKKRKVKETRGYTSDNSSPVVYTYIYDSNDSLLEERLYFMGTEGIYPRINETTITQCDIKKEKSISTSGFSEVRELVLQILDSTKLLLTTDTCENYFCEYSSSDKDVSLWIIKRQPYWCEGRRVIYTTRQTFSNIPTKE